MASADAPGRHYLGAKLIGRQGSPIAVASTAATNSVFVFIDESPVQRAEIEATISSVLTMALA